MEEVTISRLLRSGSPHTLAGGVRGDGVADLSRLRQLKRDGPIVRTH